MQWRPGGFVRLSHGEPYWRTCWVCNPAHEYLRNTDVLHYCLLCERVWIRGVDFSTIEDDHQFDEAMLAAGVQRYEKETNNGQKEEG